MVEIPTTTEPKKRGRKPGSGGRKKASADILAQDDITALIGGLYGVLAVPFGAHWRLDPVEAEGISGPLTRILNRLEIADQIAKFGDGAMLLLAVSMATVPRVMINVEQRRGRRGSVRREETQPRTNEQAGETGQVSSGVVAESPDYVPSNVRDLIPPLAQ